jgi:hypothetical protein
MAWMLLCSLAAGLVGLLVAGTIHALTGSILAAIGLCGFLLGLGLAPGAIARGRGLPNADGVGICGLLGMIIPIIWLVALIWAIAAADPADRPPPGD